MIWEISIIIVICITVIFVVAEICEAYKCKQEKMMEATKYEVDKCNEFLANVLVENEEESENEAE